MSDWPRGEGFLRGFMVLYLKICLGALLGVIMIRLVVGGVYLMTTLSVSSFLVVPLMGVLLSLWLAVCFVFVDRYG